MVRKQVTLTFTQELLQEPIIYTLGQQFGVLTNINLADISEDRGWVVLEMEGEESDIEQGIAWMISRGVRVEDAIGDVVKDEVEGRSYMLGSTECCPGKNCGCHISVFPTTRECSVCGKRLRLTGRSQLLEFRLTCQNCGYQSPLLSKEELHEVL